MPATTLVLFVVIASVVPRLAPAIDSVWRVIPIYIAFAILAPRIGWFVARVFRLDAPAGRAVAFSASTRNSLVVLPAIIVAQTLVELVSELVHVRLVPQLGERTSVTSSQMP
ncbi:hypothetical protein [Paraburkholderia terrae]|uniref:Uncharacterized protein n=1 Tax=Paraburkholderia terrae TaxID=311230 RepID=A0ABM7TZP4_9BURK|nr:hypothetical protein [Paraburkholderia terrae]BCZ84444.1 hypothetical protein PTKU64_81190 [Paraburkholderia terrae]BDC45694.1 hypothetical protein PTKU15_89910 [Paraburkholderia terrae]